MVKCISVQSCGSEINSEVGWISFPDRDGDGFYDNNMMCTWRLGVNKSEILELYIAIIGIECGYDYLEVWVDIILKYFITIIRRINCTNLF